LRESERGREWRGACPRGEGREGDSGEMRARERARETERVARCVPARRESGREIVARCVPERERGREC